MPIRYAKDIVVDQAAADLMSKAFNDALERLRLSRIRPDREPEWVREKLALRIEWVREKLALRIIESVQQRGERDPIRLRDDALSHLAQAKPPSPT